MEDLTTLRNRYPSFVITHVPGSPWIALPMWTLTAELEADSAEALANKMDEMLTNAANDPGSRLSLLPPQKGAFIPWPNP
jgi:hypothetical protein